MKRRPAGRKVGPYHHGDLRAALLASSLEILESEGVGGLSLRAVARRAGVSQAAPYGHFTDKLALLAAVAAVGFDRLTAVLSANIEGVDSAAARIVGLGRGYVEFATTNPALFRLMFGREVSPRFAADARLQEAASRSYALLSDAVVQHIAESSGEVDPVVATKAAWALVHGLSYLLNEHMPGDPCGLDSEQLVDRATRILVAGFGGQAP